ncbi:hypothetical protein J6590_005893 [Homalodisca vitripennis]|nr:hypothetical protein J6590_005893 [Homalodisca vitripennis]
MITEALLVYEYKWTLITTLSVLIWFLGILVTRNLCPHHLSEGLASRIFCYPGRQTEGQADEGYEMPALGRHCVNVSYIRPVPRIFEYDYGVIYSLLRAAPMFSCL